jgi:hypothetical protein
MQPIGDGKPGRHRRSAASSVTMFPVLLSFPKKASRKDLNKLVKSMRLIRLPNERCQGKPPDRGKIL